MREIKFRAWCKAKKIMKSPETLQLLIDMLIPYEEAVNYEFLQYTGAKDFFGTDIFDGDIVFLDSKMMNGVVENDGISWRIKFSDDLAWLCDYFEDLHVIGNIYENPELMESK